MGKRKKPNFIKAALTKGAEIFKKQRRALASALLVLGAVLMLLPSLYKSYVEAEVKEREKHLASLEDFLVVEPRYDHGPIKADPKLLESISTKENIPIRVVIPRISINLAITPARVVDGAWEIPETTAAFGLGSAPPTVVGNTVIFAHARKELFGPLRSVKAGDDVYIFTSERWFAYKVQEIKTVLPNQVEVLQATSERTLTLYTCSGFADTKRLIVTAKSSPDKP